MNANERYSLINPPGGGIVVGATSGGGGAGGGVGAGLIDLAHLPDYVNGQPYAAGSIVKHNGVPYWAVQAASGTAVPGTSQAAAVWHELTLDGFVTEMSKALSAIPHGIVGVAADAGDRDQAYPHPLDGQAVFNMDSRSIDVFNTADNSWTMVGKIPHAADVASLPGWTSKGSIMYVDDIDELYVLAPDPKGSPGDLAWKPIAGAATSEFPAWDASSGYARGDVVSHSGMVWRLSQKTSNGHEPDTTSGTWTRLDIASLATEVWGMLGGAATVWSVHNSYRTNQVVTFNMTAYQAINNNGPTSHSPATSQGRANWVEIDAPHLALELADLKAQIAAVAGSHHAGAVKTAGAKEIIAYQEYEDPSQAIDAGILLQRSAQGTHHHGKLNLFGVRGDDFVPGGDDAFPVANTKRWLSPRLSSDKSNGGGLLFGRDKEGAGVISVHVEFHAKYEGADVSEWLQDVTFNLDVADLAYSYPDGEAGGNQSTRADPSQGQRVIVLDALVPEKLNRWTSINAQLRLDEGSGVTQDLRVTRMKAVLMWEPWPDIPPLAAPVVMPAGGDYGAMPDGSTWEDDGSGTIVQKTPPTNPNWPNPAP